MTNNDNNLKLSRQMILTLSSIEDLNSMENMSVLFREIVLHLKRCLHDIDRAILGVINSPDDIFIADDSFYGITKEEIEKLGLRVDTPNFESSILKRRSRPSEESSIFTVNEKVISPLSEMYGTGALFRTFSVPTVYSSHITFFLLITSENHEYLNDRLTHNVFSLSLDSFIRTLSTILLKDENRLPSFSNDIIEKLISLPTDFDNALASFSLFLCENFAADSYLTLYYDENNNYYNISPQKYSGDITNDDIKKIVLKNNKHHMDINFSLNSTSAFLSEIALENSFTDAIIFNIPGSEDTILANIVLFFKSDPGLATNTKLFVDNQIKTLGLQLTLNKNLRKTKQHLEQISNLKNKQNDFMIRIINEIIPLITDKKYSSKSEYFNILNTVIKWEHTSDEKLPLKNLMAETLATRFGDFKNRVYGVYNSYDAFKTTIMLIIVNDYVGRESIITIQHLNQKVIVHIKNPSIAKCLPKFSKSSIIYEITKINEKALAINFDI